MGVIMLFKKLKLNYFGRFHDFEIELQPGINLIYGQNEAGKTTIHTFIKGMLFGIERLRGRASKEDLYLKYLPWEYPGAFEGSIDIEIDGKEYRLQRKFHSNNKSFTVIDLATGREVKLTDGNISEMIPGLTESTFRNTISIEQLKAQTDAELAGQVRNYITNLSIAKSNEVNVAKAVSFLMEQKKALEALQTASVLKSLQEEIRDQIAREAKMDTITLQIRTLLAEEQELRKQKEAASCTTQSEETIQMEQFPAIMEKYRMFQELTKQINQLEKQGEELKEKLAAWEQEKLAIEAIKAHLREIEGLKSELLEYEEKQKGLQKEIEARKHLQKRDRLYIITGSVCIALFVVALMGFHTAGLCVGMSVVAIGGILCWTLSMRMAKKQKQLDDSMREYIECILATNTRINQILRENGVTKVSDLSLRYENILQHYYALENRKEQLRDLENRKDEVEDRKDQLYETIMRYMQYFIADDILDDTSMQRLKVEINKRKQKVTQMFEAFDRELKTGELRIEKLRWEISTMEGNEEQLLKNKESYAELEQKQEQNILELEAIKLALNTIRELSIDIHDSFGQQINLAVSGLIGEVTDNKYTDIKVDEKLEIKVGWNGDYILLDKLSAGTMDQVYFALRLAVADLMLGKDQMPLLLDDSFALYDENRVKAALKQIAGRKQILLFSCHEREKRLLEELGLPYHLVNLSK